MRREGDLPVLCGMMRMLGRDFDSDGAERPRGCAAFPAAMRPERSGRAAGIAPRKAMAIAAGALIAGALACAAASAASAREMRLRYDVTVLGGVTLGEIEVTSLLDRTGYRIEIRTRPYRAAQLVGAAEQSGRVEGRWGRSGPEPRLYQANGSWRGRARQSRSVPFGLGPEQADQRTGEGYEADDEQAGHTFVRADAGRAASTSKTAAVGAYRRRPFPPGRQPC